MPITLKIVSYQRLTPGQQTSFETDLSRFSIGRNADNHWTLPDPQRFLSGTHCWLEFRNGAWLITDTSTNGAFLNGSKERLAKNESIKLAHGDQIRMGDYELEVDFLSDEHALSGIDDTIPGKPLSPFPGDASDDMDRPDSLGPPVAGQVKDVNTPLAQMDRGLLGGSVRIDQLHNIGSPPEKVEPPPSLASHGDRALPLQHHFLAPQVAQPPASTFSKDYSANSSEIPQDWDFETGLLKTPVIPAPAPPAIPTAATPKPIYNQAPAALATAAPELARAKHTTTAAPAMSAQPSPPRVDASSPLAAFAAGAGLDTNQLHVMDESAFFYGLGQLLSAMTDGLMRTVAARGQVKSEFRLEQTMIGPSENNPLKFSASAQEAMLRLINRQDKAYLSGAAAATSTFDDINAHQLAVMAGTEAALKSILKRFRPATLEAKFKADSMPGNWLPALRKARYWEFYKALYNEVSEAADDNFEQFFGSEFKSAYEKQLHRLKISK